MPERERGTLRRVNNVRERSGLLEAALGIIDSARAPLQAAPDALSYERLVELIDHAIHHGVPAFNAGYHDVCAQIYAHTAAALARLIEDAPSPDAGARFAGPVLDQPLTEYPEVTEENDTNAAWAYRRAFDEIGLYRVVLIGREAIAALVSAVAEEKRLKTSVIVELLFESIRHGNVLFRAQCMRAIIALHTETASVALELAKNRAWWPEQSAGYLLDQVEGLLQPHVSGERISGDPDQDAWDIYESFLTLIELQERITLRYLKEQVSAEDFELLLFRYQHEQEIPGPEVSQGERARALLQGAKAANDIGFGALWSVVEGLEGS